MTDEQSKRDIALALSSGGARGLAHIGAIEELVDEDYRPQEDAGTDGLLF